MKNFYKQRLEYLNFPVALIKNIFIDHKKCMDNVFDVAIYNFCYQSHQGPVTEDVMKESATKFGIKLGNTQKSIKNAIKLMDSIDSNGPTTGIKLDTIFDYYKNNKTEFQIATFAAYCAFRSIIGKKPFCKTNKGLVHARMFGYRSTKELPDKLSDLQSKYFTRYHFDKIKIELELNWHLKLYAQHCRGFFVSFDVTLDILAQSCKNSNKKNKIEKLKNSKREALRRASIEENSSTYLGANMVQMYSRSTAASTAP